ncbi:MAG: hypothetical protein WAS21_20395 [Geminicoccaceae bacterium]
MNVHAGKPSDQLVLSAVPTARRSRTALRKCLALTAVAVSLVIAAGPALAIASSDRYAVVNRNGTLDRGKGATFSTLVCRGVLGDYRVTFNKNVSKCMYQATIGTAYPSTPASGEIMVAPDVANVNAVRVFTRTSGGLSTNKPFYLFVGC